jgi:hypothetical protein
MDTISSAQGSPSSHPQLSQGPISEISACGTKKILNDTSASTKDKINNNK